MTRMAACGAIACTISTSPEYSPGAWNGEVAGREGGDDLQMAAGKLKTLS